MNTGEMIVSIIALLMVLALALRGWKSFNVSPSKTAMMVGIWALIIASITMLFYLFGM